MFPKKSYYWRRIRNQFSRSSISGFTLIELIAVVALIGILMAIFAPGWIRFIDTQRINSAQSVVYQGMKQAQLKAQQNKAEWQFSVRDTSGRIEWSVHSRAVPALSTRWNEVSHPIVQIDDETTLQLDNNVANTRAVRFDHRGNVSSRLGRITLSSKRFSDIKRCVYVSTLIGTIRQSKEQREPQQGDFCY